MIYEDILFTTEAGVATIAINRPKVMNAFRGRTCSPQPPPHGSVGGGLLAVHGLQRHPALGLSLIHI